MATAAPPKKRAVKKKVRTRKAPKDKRPDPEQKRLVDLTTNEPIDICYRNEGVDDAFIKFRRSEKKMAEADEAHKENSEDLKSDEEVKLEKRLKSIQERLKPLRQARESSEEFKQTKTRQLSTAEARDKARENLKAVMVVEQEAIRENMNGQPYVCIDQENLCFYVGLIEGETTLSIRKAKVRRMEDE